ncbi:probable serine/threonine-protein kinase PkwA [Aspergillus udagawae]|nr:probable serine/threonine-protein kinase PkwA [Aspergillus udagawae]
MFPLGRVGKGFEIPDHGTAISLTISPNGDTLVFGAETVQLRDIDTETSKPVFRRHTEDVSSVAHSPDSKTLALASSAKTVKLWGSAVGASQQISHEDEGSTPRCGLFA